MQLLRQSSKEQGAWIDHILDQGNMTVSFPGCTQKLQNLLDVDVDLQRFRRQSPLRSVGRRDFL